MLLSELKNFCNINFGKVYIEDSTELVVHETADLENYGAAEGH
jgi:hypothetical protein